ELVKKAWRDPVWSKVIAAAILAIIAALWSERQRIPGWTVAFRQLLFISVPLWVVACLLLGASIAFVLWNVRLQQRGNALPIGTNIFRPARIPAHLKIGIKFLRSELDPTGIAITIQNTGGTDALHVHVN